MMKSKKGLLVLLLLVLPTFGAQSAGLGLDPVWDTIVRLTTDSHDQYTGFGRQRSIATDTSDNVHVVWCDGRTVPQQIWYRQFDREQQAWLPETMLTNLTVACQRPGVACDQAGNVHVVWHTEQYPYYGIWYKRYDAQSAAWRPDTMIDSGTSTRARLFPAICCQPGVNRVHVAWYGHPDTGMFYQVFHKEYRSGSGWNATEVVTDSSCFHDQVSIAADGGDNLCVVWCGLDFGGGFNQVFCRRRAGGLWQEVELVSGLASSLTQYAPCVAADDSGGFHVVWHGRSGSDIYQRIYHRLRRPGGWTDITSLTAQPDRQQEYPSVCCLSGGECHVVWRGQSAMFDTCQLYHAQRDQSGEWSPPARLTDRSADVYHPAIAACEDSVLHVVWYDVASGNQDVYYLRGREGGVGLEADAFPTSDYRFTVAPNLLAGGAVTLRIQVIKESRNQVANLRVFDALGGCVLTRQLVIGHCDLVIPLDTRSLPNGVYIVRLTADAGDCCPMQKLVILCR